MFIPPKYHDCWIVRMPNIMSLHEGLQEVIVGQPNWWLDVPMGFTDGQIRVWLAWHCQKAELQPNSALLWIHGMKVHLQTKKIANRASLSKDTKGVQLFKTESHGLHSSFQTRCWPSRRRVYPQSWGRWSSSPNDMCCCNQLSFQLDRSAQESFVSKRSSL